jgi:hypothetical protein
MLITTIALSHGRLRILRSAMAQLRLARTAVSRLRLTVASVRKPIRRQNANGGQERVER